LSEKIRSFISVDITDRVLTEKITELQQTLTRVGADLKLVEPENIHLTLRFLGEIDLSTLEAVREGIKSVKYSSFMLSLKGVGVFPNLRHMNVVWVGISEGEKNLREITEKLESILKRISFPPDHKGFSPHLTIARVKTSRNKDKLANLIVELKNFHAGSMLVDSVKLKKSILTPKGPLYSTIDSVSAT